MKKILLGLLFLVAPLCAAETLLIKAKKAYPVSGKPVSPAFILVENGRIKAIKTKEIKPPAGTKTIEAEVVIPGIIDAASYTGLRPPLNEQSKEVTPAVQIADCFDPSNPEIIEALSHGITTVQVTPGSRNVVGGLCAIIRTYGPRDSRMILDRSSALKAVMGVEASNGNRSWDYGPPRNIFFRRPTTRMANAQVLGDAFSRVKDAAGNKFNRVKDAAGKKFNGAKNRSGNKFNRAKNKPGKNGKLSPGEKVVAEALSNRLPLLIRSGYAIDIRIVLKQAKEFNLKPVIEGGWEAYKVADELKAAGLPVVLCPFALGLLNMRPGAFDSCLNNAGILVSKGVKIAFSTTDTGIDPLFVGSMAVRNGLSEKEALRAITLGPAEILHIEKNCGSLDPGKKADMVILSGAPFSSSARVLEVIGEGKIVFPKERGH